MIIQLPIIQKYTETMMKPPASVTAKIIKSILKVAHPTGLLQLQHHCSKNNKAFEKKTVQDS
jgi:hypothetical protein